MSDSAAETAAEFFNALLAACRENVSAAAESLNQCFDSEYGLEFSDQRPLDEESQSDLPTGPGLVVRIGLDHGDLVALLPESLPLPDWYREPDDSQSARLQTLAMEWSLNLLPEDVEATDYRTDAVDDLSTLFDEDNEERFLSEVTLEGSDASIFMLFPITRESAEAEADETESEDAAKTQRDEAEPESSTEHQAAEPESAEPETSAEPEMDEAEAERLRRVARLMKLPVEVVVHLAAKKIELSQLLALSPGSLITFNKSCEELLDLYVNNHRYCRGEAVKIGEKFGLKINEVGFVEKRPSKVL